MVLRNVSLSLFLLEYRCVRLIGFDSVGNVLKDKDINMASRFACLDTNGRGLGYSENY